METILESSVTSIQSGDPRHITVKDGEISSLRVGVVTITAMTWDI